MKQCTTHHHACDCREKKMREVCKYLIKSHSPMQIFVDGYYAVEKAQCLCDGCKSAREILGVKE